MKIAILGILGENLEDQAKIGGVGAFNKDLIKGLHDRGHIVTLFNIEEFDSKKIIKKYLENDYLASSKEADFMRLSGLFRVIQFMDFIKVQENFDFVHVSTFEWYYFLPFISLLKIPHLITVHSQIIKPKVLEILLKKYSDVNLVFISQNQKENFPKIKNSWVVYNGIDLKNFKFSLNGHNYLAWLGRIHPNKGLDTALLLAKKTKKSIIYAGSGQETPYFQKLLKKYPENNQFKFLGKVDLAQKNKLFAGAKVTLFPIRWDEPFGLVLLESMACGTPVIAFNRGSSSEIIINGQNGFLCAPDNTEEMTNAIRKIFSLSAAEYQKMRQFSRRHVEENFSAQKMAREYEKIYRSSLDNWNKS